MTITNTINGFVNCFDKSVVTLKSNNSPKSADIDYVDSVFLKKQNAKDRIRNISNS